MRRYVLFAAKAAITLGLLAVIFHNVESAPVVARLTDAAWGWLGVAAALALGQQALIAVRWSVVCRILGFGVGRLQALRFLLIGGFFGQALPTGLGGDAVRAWLLVRAGTDLRRAISSVLCDRVFAMALLLALACATVPIYFDRVGSAEARAGLSVVLAGLAAGMALTVALGPRLLSRFGRFALGEAAHLTLLDLQRVFAGSRVSLGLGLLTLVGHGVMLLCFFALARALGVPLGLLDCLAIIPPIMLATALPISIAGWGVREGAMVAGLALLGVAAEAALALSIAFGLLQIVIVLPGGLLWAFMRGNALPRSA